MGNSLSFPGVLRSITGVKQSTIDGYERIVIFANSSALLFRIHGEWYLPFQPASAVAVNNGDCFMVCNRNVMRLYSN